MPAISNVTIPCVQILGVLEEIIRKYWDIQDILLNKERVLYERKNNVIRNVKFIIYSFAIFI